MTTETVQNAPAKVAPKAEPEAAKAAPEVEQAAVVDPNERVAKAEAIIHRNVLWSLGTGLLPFPIVDMALTLGVQVKMIKELSDLYGAKFSESIVRKLLISLVSSVGGVGLGGLLGSSLIKLIPTVGTTLGVVSAPIVVAAFTHAAGRVFLLHLESGGSVLTFDPHQMRAHFREEFEKAKEKVAQLQKEQAKAGGKAA